MGKLFSKIIEQFPFLQDIPEDLFIHKTIHKDDLIFSEGDYCGGIPLIIDGIVRVSKVGKNGREMNMYRVGHGDTCVLTVTSVLSGNPYPATAVVEEDGEAMILPIEQFKNFMISNTLFQQYIYNLIIERFQEVLLLIDEIIFQRTDERIIRFLLKHTNENQKVIEITHDKIAVELGTAREVVSRFLKEMERGGWIQLTRGKIILKNRDILLQKIADCD